MTPVRWSIVLVLVITPVTAGCGAIDGAAISRAERPSSTSTSTAAPSTSGASQLQLDPPVRDVRVRVDGAVVSSDASGRLELPAGAYGEVEVVFVGYSATPAVRRVRFAQWSDGSTMQVRTVDLTKPVPMLQVELLHRVVVAAPDALGSDVLRFESAVGVVDLPIGVPTWIPARRSGDDGLITYTSAVAPAQEFEPTPEARWVIGAQP